MSGKSIDMVGQRYNRLLVIKKFKVINEITHWECLCDCGKTITVARSSLLTGNTSSCGCLWRERFFASNITHGLTGHPLHSIWFGIKSRCYQKKDGQYKNYGARGVRMCKEWKSDFKKFYDWCIENGWKKGMHVDKDIKGNGRLYSPDTCLIVTGKENNRHRIDCIMLLHNGEVKPLTTWCDIYGLRAGTIRTRYARGNKNPLDLPKRPHKNSAYAK